MTGFSVRPLDETTWLDFARLVARHNGVWGGCWCMAFHPEGVGRGRTASQNRSEKECRVREGRAHAALVFDGTACVGWCQFGPTDELPRIKHGRAYREGLGVLPDFEREGFEATRRLGKNHWVVTKRVRRSPNRGAARAGQNAAQTGH